MRQQSLLHRADRARHRIPFWWWLTYDALVAFVIIIGISPRDPAFWIGFGTLAIAVVIDTVEFWVKSPRSRARLAHDVGATDPYTDAGSTAARASSTSTP